MRIVGILLAAGSGTRFGGDKLLAPLPEAADDIAAGTPVGVAACGHLVGALAETIAVVRVGDFALAATLSAAGAHVIECARADEGMGASLSCGVDAAANADGWVVALADMPWITTATIVRVASAIADGAIIAAPFVGGQRGHPVGFGAATLGALRALSGDQGAREIVKRYETALVRIDVDDRGSLRDIDTPADLSSAR